MKSSTKPTLNDTDVNQAIKRLIRAAKSASLVTRIEDDPANLPDEILQEIDEAVYQVERRLYGPVPLERCICCGCDLRDEGQFRGACGDCTLDEKES